MIIVKLKGGLGNQMFQYALGRHLAEKYKTELKLDIMWFDGYMHPTKRFYELCSFNIFEKFATKNEVLGIKGYNFIPQNFITYAFSRLYDNYKAKHNEKYIMETKYEFDENILSLENDIYLEGYWQSPKYFEEIHNLLLNDFQVKTQPKGVNENLLEKIKKSESVAVHIRRGDYVDVKKSNKVVKFLSDLHNKTLFSPCSEFYYQRSVEHIKNNIENPVLFIFSDDPKWAEQNLKFPLPSNFIGHNPADKGYEDLRLMMNCKHFITANSSFSWWGAWLSNNPDKMIIAPKNWFNSAKMSTKDLIPEDWILI